jgi:cysteinyl-tRNA synthetase
MLMTHYTQPLDWTARKLDEAYAMLDRWYSFLKPRGPSPAAEGNDVDSEFVDALMDDLNTPSAIARLSALVGQSRGRLSGYPALQLHWKIQRTANLLGLLEHTYDEWMAPRSVPKELYDRVTTAIAERLEARRAKDFGKADRIRDELAAMGIELKDAKDPKTGELFTTWEVAR